MRWEQLFLLCVWLLLGSCLSYAGTAQLPQDEAVNIVVLASDEHQVLEATSHHLPAVWAVIPFVVLLAMIATGPLFYPHFWHRYYPLVAVALGFIVVLYYLVMLGNTHQPVHSLAEYFSFIALLTSLFVASGGILIKVDKEGTPAVNLVLLIIGAMIANIIGTTGASMLLIRPFIRLNRHRIKPYHVVFFIFMVSNVGGCLTPIGDPPLFLGFLKGIPFFWTVQHLWVYWLFGIGLLGAIFYFIDKRNSTLQATIQPMHYTGNVVIKGTKNVFWLVVIIASVFLDPVVIEWVPALHIMGERFSFVRELIMFSIAYLAYRFSSKEALRGNEFNFEPIKEVAYLFIGIFATMMPALQLVSHFAHSPQGQQLVNVSTLYWMTGALSSVLDNAPTYLTFLAAGMGKLGLDINLKNDVIHFAEGAVNKESIVNLTAIAIAAVFFGAMTYIGNAPNFMVRAIAEQSGIRMPSFVGFVIKYSFPILLPVLFLTWWVFFYLMR